MLKNKRFIFSYIFLICLFLFDYLASPNVIPNYLPVMNIRIVLFLLAILIIGLTYYYPKLLAISQIVFILLFSLLKILEVSNYLPRIHKPELLLSLFVFSGFLSVFLLIFCSISYLKLYISIPFFVFAAFYEYLFFLKLRDLSILVFILFLAVTLASAIISFLMNNEVSQKRKIKDLYWEEIELNKKIVSMKGRLFEQERFFSLSMLTAGIAHELGNPVNFLNGNLYFINDYMKIINRLIDKTTLEDEDQHKLNKINDDFQTIMEHSRTGFDNIIQVINNMKAMYNNQKNSKEITDLKDMLVRTCDFFKASHNDYSYTIQIDIDQDYKISIQPGEYYIVFSNILNNSLEAIRSTGKEGHISIKAKRMKEFIKISISDTGCGIPENDLIDIFNPFYSTKKGDQNLGLGLALSKEIIEADKGKIDVISEVGKGTIINIFIAEKNND